MVEAMLNHATHDRPAEACGLLAVDSHGKVRFVYCLSNADASAGAFTIAPEEYFGANRHAERQGWEIAGVFHSHPNGSPGPSATDLAKAPAADWLYIVVARGQARLYVLQDRRFRLVGRLAANLGSDDRQLPPTRAIGSLA
jgi:proteasome lid subunit RPN8/RPN11